MWQIDLQTNAKVGNSGYYIHLNKFLQQVNTFSKLFNLHYYKIMIVHFFYQSTILPDSFDTNTNYNQYYKVPLFLKEIIKHVLTVFKHLYTF